MATVQTDEVFQSVTESIEYAEAAMSKARTGVDKARTSKENRNKVVSKASEIVNALLEPALQVANLLDGIGAFFPPCKVASNTLAVLVQLEVDRRDNDVRIALLFLDLATALANLGALNPGFQTVTTLTRPLENLLQRFTGLMKEFGQFCEVFYEAKALKSKLKHLLHSKSNKDSLQDFTNRLVALKHDLTSLLSQQAVLILSTHTDALSRIESRLAKNHGFYAAVSDGNEDSATTFVSSHGGEEVVRTNDQLLEQLAATVGENLNPGILRVIKEGVEETFKHSQASFMLKFQFALEQRIDESQEMILNELKSGPYELICNPDMKEIWKNIAAKESSVKRRQLIDGMNYYFNRQFKQYKAEHNRAEREDSWTKAIISKVHFHPSIGDAIDDDNSGYISIEEVNDFLRKKPEKWTLPQWIAYWAYGWDADNRLYKERINKTYTQLQKLRDAGGPRGDLVAYYLSETQERAAFFVNSLYIMRDLDPSVEMKMDRLRDELRTRNENEIKMRLRSVSHRIDYSVLAALTGSDRIESTFCPLTSLLVSRHLWLMSKPNVSSEVVEQAISSVVVLVDAMRDRITDLKMIWRRQRTDVDTQIRYYANGLLEDYYRKYRKQEFDTELEDFEEQSVWDSEDAWTSEDGGESGQNADTSDVAEQTTSRSIPVVGQDSVLHSVLQQVVPPRGNGDHEQRSYGQGQDEPELHSPTNHEVQGHGEYGDVAHNYDEDAEGEAVDEFEGGADQPEGDDEEVREQEPDEEGPNEEQDYAGGEPVDEEEDEQGYNAQDEDYEGGEAAEEDEDDGGYGYEAPRRWGQWGQ
ncbi:hypothetical protein BJV74DRAFT_407332 [Russula compacta]|nr:hypothetical protein BJV74DRAFT_407332 [Russula compacta]